LAEVYKSAMLVKSKKAEIFQVGKRNIQNWKMIGKWGNAKIALLRSF
jgi:3-deoxy-D-arabino-heptulosonate 7-phosphate (DAHP) synthase